MHENRRRLTSWKEIAAHLGRDVRTVLRWEKDRGLPIHRVPGITGRVVFAFADELDTWARGDVELSRPTLDAVAPPESIAVVSIPPAVSVPEGVPPRLRWWLAAAAVFVAVGAIGWRARGAGFAEPTLTFAWTDSGIVASGPDGIERWRYRFPAGENVNPPRGRLYRPADVLGGADPGVLTATSTRTRAADSIIHSGDLLWLAPDGAVRRSLTIEDRIAFGAVVYGAPWSITDFRADPSHGPRRVVVSAHHYEWWPSIVTLYDEGWTRRGTFVNAGWIEKMEWISRDRLIIAGFSNAFDGGMVALLDPGALDGQSPSAPGSTFVCTSCGSATPIRYVVLPRTEVNRASASPFNRALLVARADTLLVRTVEMTLAAPDRVADALYEFTPSLELIRATYSDRYWEVHRQLETQGKITHTREQCPDRDGPREIRVWEPKTGWRTVLTAR